MTDTAEPLLGEGPDALPELYRSGRAKRARSRAARLVAYTVGIAAVGAVVLLADWETVGEKYFDLERAKDQFPEIITIAAKNTLIYTVFSFIGGVAIGLTMAVMRLSSIRPYRWAAAIYIEVFRGLPALLTIIFVGFIGPIALKYQYPEVLGVPSGGIVALSLVAGAYLAETLRAGIEAVPRGQVEAARSLGMTHTQTLRWIVIPQAFRVVIPPLTNELVLLLKDTALLSVLGTTITSKELTQFGRSNAQDFNGTSLVVAGAVYLAITIPLTRLVAVLERRDKDTR
ncbi:MAG: amino acid ABC transporter permease [Acidimicrobiales bacterium]|jgi:polar amino acid transport system permease protein|nr:amino acid ABC transporter permease [Acidimicrobiales bacterium]